MFIVIITISILVITCFIWLLNRILPFKICPICAGVSGTWLWMLVGKLLGYEINLVILAMLMGGSVVGVAYQIEKHLPLGRSPLLWKTFFIPAGFVAVYSVILSWWPVFIALAILFAILIFKFFEQKKSDKTTIAENNSRIEDLENKMKNCC